MNPIVHFAKEKFGDVIAVVNLYTMTFVWADTQFASPLLYTSAEMVDMNARDVMTLDYKGVVALAGMLMGANHLTDRKPLKRKDGVVLKTEAVLSSFTYEGDRFVAVHSMHVLS